MSFKEGEKITVKIMRKKDGCIGKSSEKASLTKPSRRADGTLSLAPPPPPGAVVKPPQLKTDSDEQDRYKRPITSL